MLRTKFVFKLVPIGLAITMVLVLVAVALSPTAAVSPLQSEPPSWEYQVVRAYFDDPAMVAALAAWIEPWEVNYEAGYVVVGVTPGDYKLLTTLGFRVEVDSGLSAALNQPRQALPGQGGDTIPGFPCYRTVEGTFTALQDMASTYPQLASVVDIGDSWEKTQDSSQGYDLLVLVLSNQNVPGPKPKLFISSSVHPREYAPPELSTRFAEYLLQNYGQDADVTWLLDYNEIHLLTFANPDGRKQAETGLLWRKNTNNLFCSDTDSRGVDLNRNFGFGWNCCGGSSGNVCDETYRGPSAASEPETQAIQAYMRSIFPDQRGDSINDPAPAEATGIYLDTHSFSKLVLWPWGGYNSPTPNGEAIQTLGRKFAYFNGYTPQQAIDLYPTDGTTLDFGYGDLGVPSYTFELGTWFFQDCQYFEGIVLPDNLAAYLYAAKAARTPYLTPAGPDALDVVLSSATVSVGTPVTLTATLDDTRFNNSNGAEPFENIAAAEYYLDVPPWITATVPISLPMAPVDGSFDQPVEVAAATIDTTGLPLGRHILFVRGRDAAGNWGAVSAVFLWIEEEPAPALYQMYFPWIGAGE